MLKKALYVYFSGYHPRNYRKLLNSFWVVWSFTYFTIMTGINHSETVFASVENSILYYSMIIPLVFMFGGNLLVPLTLQKQMFLCPMEERERKEYILVLTAVKIAVPLAVIMIILTVQLVFFRKNIILLGGLLFAYFSLAVAITMSSGVEKVKKGKEDRFWAKKGVARTICVLNLFWTIFHILFAAIGVLEEKEISIGTGIGVAISVGMQLILTIWLLKRNIPVILENAVDYETAIQVNSDDKNVLFSVTN